MASSSLSLLFCMALRNIPARRSNVLVGLLLLFCTLALVVGNAFVGSIAQAMGRGITESITGHLQIYSQRAEEEISLFDAENLSENLPPLSDFPKLEKTLLAHPNVKAVVPMGIRVATVTLNNFLDDALLELRAKLREGKSGTAPELSAHITQVRYLLSVLNADLLRAQELLGEQALAEDLAAVEKARSDTFWQGFSQEPFAPLEFLENRVARLWPDGKTLDLFAVGTRPEAMQKAFDRIQLVEGSAIPEGRRGVLLEKQYYQETFMLRSAHRLEQLHQALTQEGRHLAEDPKLQRWLKEAQWRASELLLALKGDQVAAVQAGLAQALGQNAPLPQLVTTLFQLDDSNIAARYQLFQKVMAPALKLYRLKPQDTVVLQGRGRNGYAVSVPTQFYGIFQFKGLEHSEMTQGLNLLDLISFTELQGITHPELASQLKQLSDSEGLKQVDRAGAEEVLFGEPLPEEPPPPHDAPLNDQTLFKDLHPRALVEAQARQHYSRAQMEQGAILSVAVVLHHPEQLEKTRRELSEQLGSWDLQVASWKEAAGFLFQFVELFQYALWALMTVLFVVLALLITNALTMAMLRRTQEMGTLRALGAQRSLIAGMVLLETLLLSALFGSVGGLLGVAFIQYLGKVGVPATSEGLYLAFSGPRLFPHLSLWDVLVPVAAVMGLSLLSALSPLAVALRITPVRAMQSED